LYLKTTKNSKTTKDKRNVHVRRGRSLFCGRPWWASDTDRLHNPRRFFVPHVIFGLWVTQSKRVMKKSLLLITISLFAGLHPFFSQTLKTYDGDFKKGKAKYTYFENPDGTRIYQGKFTYVEENDNIISTDNLYSHATANFHSVHQESGNYLNGKKDGIWTISVISYNGTMLLTGYEIENYFLTPKVSVIDGSKEIDHTVLITLPYKNGQIDGVCKYVSQKPGENRTSLITDERIEAVITGDKYTGTFEHFRKESLEEMSIKGQFNKDGRFEGSWFIVDHDSYKHLNLKEIRAYSDGYLASYKTVDETTGNIITQRLSESNTENKYKHVGIKSSYSNVKEKNKDHVNNNVMTAKDPNQFALYREFSKSWCLEYFDWSEISSFYADRSYDLTISDDERKKIDTYYAEESKLKKVYFASGVNKPTLTEINANLKADLSKLKAIFEPSMQNPLTSGITDPAKAESDINDILSKDITSVINFKPVIDAQSELLKQDIKIPASIKAGLVPEYDKTIQALQSASSYDDKVKILNNLTTKLKGYNGSAGANKTTFQSPDLGGFKNTVDNYKSEYEAKVARKVPGAAYSDYAKLLIYLNDTYVSPSQKTLSNLKSMQDTSACRIARNRIDDVLKVYHTEYFRKNSKDIFKKLNKLSSDDLEKYRLQDFLSDETK